MKDSDWAWFDSLTPKERAWLRELWEKDNAKADKEALERLGSG
jgi:hypothetical protein